LQKRELRARKGEGLAQTCKFSWEQNWLWSLGLGLSLWVRDSCLLAMASACKKGFSSMVQQMRIASQSSGCLIRPTGGFVLFFSTIQIEKDVVVRVGSSTIVGPS
jgi:hypothetical protein